MEIEVAVPAPIQGTFTYRHPFPLQEGTRVIVPFGRRKLVGVSMATLSSKPKSSELFDIKDIIEVIDPAPVFSPALMSLARWMASYYFYPIGEVLRAMLPGGTKKIVRETVRGGKSLEMTPDSALNALIRTILGKKSSLRRETFLKKFLSDPQANQWAGAEPGARATVLDRLIKLGLITIEVVRDVKTRESDSSQAEDSGNRNFSATLETAAARENDLDLTPCQKLALEQVNKAVEESNRSVCPKPILLFGITGSGKTEVYLRAIAYILSLAKETDPERPQVLMLVPEISLTPQTTAVFQKRFGDAVAVVHSAMPEDQRWEAMESVRSGRSTVLIGPRSAAFAPFRKLSLVIVDEEHDPSYKQGSGLLYNGRDVAIVRARLECCAVLLGSATPSLESFHNAQRGKFDLVQLKERPSGRSLPEVKIIVSAPARSKGAIIGAPVLHSEAGSKWWPKEIGTVPVPIDEQIVEGLRANHLAGKQSIVLVNRRGYAYYVFSLKKGEAIRCPQCSISMVLHKKSAALRCHYCDHSQNLRSVVEQHQDDKLVAIGYGSERTEEALRSLIPDCRIERLDSDTATDRDHLARILGDFRNGAIDILVGTQILAKGHDFPNVTLVAALEIDQILDFPDFRAGERTFQLVVQAAGRAGRAEHPGTVMIQCMREDHPVIVTALRQDYLGFVEQELPFRKAHGYPPFGHMIAIEFNSSEASEITQLKRSIESWIDSFEDSGVEAVKQIRILGPTPPPIDVVRGRSRLVCLFQMTQGPALSTLHQVVGQFVNSFQNLKGDLRMRIDVDPQSLL